jgi:uncharacterized membrane protein YcaP (DUF421 family)
VEIIFRAAVIFVVLWAVTRSVGRSTLGELSTFELLLYVTMGDLVQQAVTQQDYSLTGGVLAVGTFALLTLGLSWVQWRFPRTRPYVTGHPLLIFEDGEPVVANLKTQRLAVADLLAAAREQGIDKTSDIEYAVLEADGRISFFTKGPGSEGAPEKAAASS